MDAITVIILIAAVVAALVVGVIYSTHLHAKALATVKEGAVLQQGVVAELHAAEAAGHTTAGTLQRFVESHLALMEAKAKAIAQIL